MSKGLLASVWVLIGLASLWLVYEIYQGDDPVADLSDAIGLSADSSDDGTNDSTGDGIATDPSSYGGTTTPMTLSDSALATLETFEGTGPNGPLVAYKDVAGVWTIGWGATHMPDGSPVVEGDTLDSIDDAQALLQNNVSTSERIVLNHVKVPLLQNQFDALVLLVYNIGEGKFSGSSLLAALNLGNYAQAQADFSQWTKAHVNGVLTTVTGLVNRETITAGIFGGGN